MSSPTTPPLCLIPYPQRLKLQDGRCALPQTVTIRLLSGINDRDRLTAGQLARELHTLTGHPAVMRATARPRDGAVAPDIGLRHERLDFSNSPEAYRLSITPDGISIGAATAQGRFYGAQTLRQLLRQFGSPQDGGVRDHIELPALEIEDAPDLPQRGVMLDVSRGKVPRLATLKALIERFAELKYNQLQLYIEHTFNFERHPLLGAGHSPLTPADIMELAAHCRDHHIALVPNLQSFGHVAHTLEHERYRHLAESDFRGGWTLSPVDTGTYDLLRELYEEYLPCFSHRPFFNVDCDETWDLGKGRSNALATRIGVGRVYLDHLLKVHELLQPHGCRMMFWGDIIVQHPELVPELPRDVILLNWGYDGHGKEARYIEGGRLAQQARLKHWVCPGTGAWLSFFFRKDNARACLREWAQVARSTGATGYVNTDWGDDGHLNCISNSYWSFAYGADRAWRVVPDAENEAAFDERFLAVMLPGAPRHWLELLDLLGNQYQVFAPSNGLPNNIHRALLSGHFEPDPEGGFKVRYFVGEWPLPGVSELRAALEISRRALAILEPGAAAPHSTGLSPEIDLVEREWLAQTLLGTVASQRALAFYGEPDGGSAAERGALLQRGLDLLEAAWHERNRPSDWAETRARIEAANHAPTA